MSFLGFITGAASAHAQMSTSTVSTFFDGLTLQAWDLLVYAWGEMFPIIILLAVVAMLIGLAISIITLGRRKRRK